MSRGRPVLGTLLLCAAAVFAVGAWSAYTSPFVSFGSRRVALSDEAIGEVEKLARTLERSEAGGVLNRLSASTSQRIRDQRNSVTMAAAGAGVCLLGGLVALAGLPPGRGRSTSASLGIGLSGTFVPGGTCPDCGAEGQHMTWCPREASKDVSSVR